MNDLPVGRSVDETLRCVLILFIHHSPILINHFIKCHKFYIVKSIYFKTIHTSFIV